MTTYISLAASATMIPAGSQILTSALTPELIKARLAHPELCVSALNNDHQATIDAIRRRYDLELPLSVPGPNGRAPKIQLGSGDELFIVQASLPRLAAGEVHSDETVNAAPISFLRWRIPVAIEVRAPWDVPQLIFGVVIDHAYSIALWQRGSTQLKGVDELHADLEEEYREFEAAWRARMLNPYEKALECDVYLESADVLYKALCLHYAGEADDNDSAWHRARRSLGQYVDLRCVIDVLLAEYARRASGLSKDIEAERALAAPLLR